MIPAAQANPRLVELITALLQVSGNELEATQTAARLFLLGGRRRFDSGRDEIATPVSGQCNSTPGFEDGIAAHQTSSDSDQCAFKTDPEGVLPRDLKGLSSHGEMWSKGSMKHPNGCTPCAFYCFKRPGCGDGEDCNFCHMQHTSKTQSKRNEWKRRHRENNRRAEAPAGGEAPQAPCFADAECEAAMVPAHFEMPAMQADPQFVELPYLCLDFHGGEPEAPHLGTPAKLGGHRWFDSFSDETIAPVSDLSTCDADSRTGMSESENGTVARQTSVDSTQCATETGPDNAAPEDRKTQRANGEMWTKGSTNHPHGCTPCAFYCFKLQGCANGKDCDFCHMHHTSKTQSRRDEWKRRQREKQLREKHQRAGAPAAGVQEAPEAPRPADKVCARPSPEELPIPRIVCQGGLGER